MEGFVGGSNKGWVGTPKSEWFRVVGDFDKCLNFVKLEKNLQKFTKMY